MHSMNVDLWKLFVEIAEHGSLTRVANPTLSFGTTSANGIMDLERQGGVYGTTFV
jgi:hypothetical protein